jgi:hypothetical protein
MEPSREFVDIECSICFDKFSLLSQKQPRLMECGHTYCISCISQFKREHSGWGRERVMTIECPLRCSEITTIDGSCTLESLKLNYQIINAFLKPRDLEKNILTLPCECDVLVSTYCPKCPSEPAYYFLLN